MLDNEKLLFDELYEKTKDCGRVQFVKLLMTKERENQELKKQLEEYKNSQSCSFVNICKSTKIANYNQQKEFIKWLENEIHTIETTYSQINGNYGLINETLEALKEVLQKYKEIIGVEDESR